VSAREDALWKAVAHVTVLASAEGRTQASVERLDASVAIIGAGPYGLAAAAYLRAENIETIAFGEPMSFWERSMPVGMLLRSSPRSSSIADPQRTLTLASYERVTSTTLAARLTLETFIDYGHWFRSQVVPGLDSRSVARVDRASNGFCLLLEDGEEIRVARVVVAAGIAPFARRPVQFAGLPDELASHSSAIREVERFGGSRVVVVGGGQSGLETAALLHEAGAEVELVVRAAAIKWIRPAPKTPSAVGERLRQLMYPPTDVGPPGLNWIAGTPDVVRWLPGWSRVELEARCTPPMGSGWLVPRLAEVPVTLGRSVVSATAAGPRARLVLDDGSRREVDHVVLATGYRIDVAKYGFLGPELLGALNIVDGYPCLRTGLESSVPGLHFVGAPAAATFGPVMRFVTGGWYCGPALARKLSGKPPLALRFAW